ncbi:hypothetical protein QC763_0093070 [Podospora pseudopauciseta]|uniref:Uncharacterized protein n=1 Tax=Podospora pseudopauciseta TaxID=2093780 RepID=A0ABR0H4C6_9PEZI|nr:hypothetical protein QC763_0093070 [Podospora pseudopauciseta]
MTSGQPSDQINTIARKSALLPKKESRRSCDADPNLDEDEGQPPTTHTLEEEGRQSNPRVSVN